MRTSLEIVQGYCLGLLHELAIISCSSLRTYVHKLEHIYCPWIFLMSFINIYIIYYLTVNYLIRWHDAWLPQERLSRVAMWWMVEEWTQMDQYPKKIHENFRISHSFVRKKNPYKKPKNTSKWIGFASRRVAKRF